MRKSLLDRLAENPALKARTDRDPYPRINLRVKPSSRYGGSHYLVSVGSDHIEISSDSRGRNPVFVDRSVIIEAFMG
jgi:hypothetical protein